jgi:hypothetical protein
MGLSVHVRRQDRDRFDAAERVLDSVRVLLKSAQHGL